MNFETKKVWVTGHKNPDTDSICAAIAYAYLKNQLEDREYVPKRAGSINAETRYVLDYFHIDEPELVTDAGAQIKDISIRKTLGVSSHISLKKAWELMKKLDVVTLPVTNRIGKLEGIIVTKDIATSYMDVYDSRALSNARTQYKNIAEEIGNETFWFHIMPLDLELAKLPERSINNSSKTDYKQIYISEAEFLKRKNDTKS